MPWSSLTGACFRPSASASAVLMQNFRRAYERLSARTPDSLLETDLERLAQMGETNEGGAPLREEALPSLASAVVDTGIIPLREETLLRLEQEQAALAKGREASALLLTEVNTLVTEINAEAVESSNAAQSAAQTGRLILGVLNVLSISGALSPRLVICGTLYDPPPGRAGHGHAFHGRRRPGGCRSRSRVMTK